jgi:hypothetical protein
MPVGDDGRMKCIPLRRPHLLAVPVLLLLIGCGGGGGGSSTPTTYPIAGSYYGTVVTAGGNTGNMGLTTDALGNGNFAVQYPNEPALEETFAPPVSSVSGDTLRVNGSIAGLCTFAMTASMSGPNTISGTYTANCPGQGAIDAHFSLPRGSYQVDSKFHRMLPPAN